jgi:predicted metal-dependent phosphoesterase TrpH
MGYGTEIINNGAVADLHIHTQRSDGDLTAREIIRIIAAYNNSIKEGKIKAEPFKDISFTDHHSCKVYDESIYLARQYGLNLISGIEISTRDFKACHVLGYGIIDRPGLDEIYKEDIKIRGEKLLDYINVLECERKIILDADWIQDTAEKHRLSHKLINQKAKEFLREHGRETEGEFAMLNRTFENTVGKMDADQSHEYKHLCADAVKTIVDAGGVPILAHPWSWKTRRESTSVTPRQVIEYMEKHLLPAGLKGFELSQNTEKFGQDLYRDFAKSNDLITTGGSDFHDPAEKKLGAINIGTAQVDKLKYEIHKSNENYKFDYKDIDNRR